MVEVDFELATNEYSYWVEVILRRLTHTPLAVAVQVIGPSVINVGVFSHSALAARDVSVDFVSTVAWFGGDNFSQAAHNL